MDSPSIDMVSLRSAVFRGQIQWQRHALERMLERGIHRSEVVETLLSGTRIADYPQDNPLPSALVLGWIEMRPLHVVVAYNDALGVASIITVYEPSPEYFEADFRTRKRK